jgi:hypothetical protein
MVRLGAMPADQAKRYTAGESAIACGGSFLALHKIARLKMSIAIASMIAPTLQAI